MKNLFLIASFLVGFVFAPAPYYCYPESPAHNLSVTNGGHGDINYSATIKCRLAQTPECSACALLDVFYIGENTGAVLLTHDAWSPNLSCGVTATTSKSITRAQLNGFMAIHINPNETLPSDYILSIWRGLDTCVETSQIFYSELECDTQ